MISHSTYVDPHLSLSLENLKLSGGSHLRYFLGIRVRNLALGVS